VYSSVDTIWVLLGTALVFFMKAGFAMVETGFTRAKNAGNIVMKNLMDFCLGTPIFWLIGFGIMFGAGNGFWGWLDPLVRADYSFLGLSFPLPVYLVFQTVFCATAATIVSGAMAERTRFSAYCIYSMVISAVIYPISGHWIRGGGWLSQLGFHDFAGSTAVHMVGGVAALTGAKILRPRLGKYDKQGNPRAILGHSLTLGGLVAITAGCDLVSPSAPWAVHGMCGAAGTLLIGLLALDGGLLYGGMHFFLVQLLGVASVILWGAVTMTAVFALIKKAIGLWVSEAEEIAGLDIIEHGLVSSYADFAPAGAVPGILGAGSSLEAVSPQAAVPVVALEEPKAAQRQVAGKPDVYTKLVVIFKQSRFEKFKAAMEEIGITGMTLTQVLGCGMQKGANEFYRGIPVEMGLLPKVQVEIVVCKVPVQTVIDAARHAPYTGHIGDGKIFVYNVENVIKIRTGQQGYDALQDENE
jgi:ammonia channel protein AmtB/nitrogen regulatory protein PII